MEEIYHLNKHWNGSLGHFFPSITPLSVKNMQCIDFLESLNPNEPKLLVCFASQNSRKITRSRFSLHQGDAAVSNASILQCNLFDKKVFSNIRNWNTVDVKTSPSCLVPKVVVYLPFKKGLNVKILFGGPEQIVKISLLSAGSEAQMSKYCPFPAAHLVRSDCGFGKGAHHTGQSGFAIDQRRSRHDIKDTYMSVFKCLSFLLRSQNWHTIYKANEWLWIVFSYWQGYECSA